MKIENLIWYSAKNEEIPGSAFGRGIARGQELLSPMSGAPDTPAWVGYSRSENYARGYQPPSLFMLREASAAETLSWLRVYAKGSFPLSQFARVITDTDWEQIFSKQSEGVSTRTDKWASVVLGEILAQGDPEIELEGIPLSRASACYSTAVARAIYLHYSFAITRACIERLRATSETGRFAKRAITVDALVPLWALVSVEVEDRVDLHELGDLVLHAAERMGQQNLSISALRKLYQSSPHLFSDSAEERVVAFQRIVEEASAYTSRNGRPLEMTAALIAIAAYLVGRGTSHAFLLKKFSAVAPTVYVLFGVIAALHGARGWDANWSKLAKGIERQLRSSFEMKDPPAADICWTEYAWLAKNINSIQGLSELPRQFPRALSIEIVPGAMCQFRLASDTRGVADTERQSTLGAREAEVRNTLEQLASLSARARQLLDSMSPNPSHGNHQSALEFEKAKPDYKTKPRRAYKKTVK